VLGFEFPNGEPVPTFFQFSGNRISNNKFTGNGTSGKAFAGDVTLEGGMFNTPETGESVNNCVSNNSFTAATFPRNIQGTWGCQHKTTPNPGTEPFGYVVELSAESRALHTQEGQPAPGPQPTKPNPCDGVPKNALCK